ncbi:hypothetical protein BS78_10G013600 [Paspalum vaginatum]|nr:hypothetical protein BS78_10G013600 [Paspalum vaginatum]
MHRLDGNQTFLRCPPAIDRYIHNLTSSYTQKSNEASMVSASVIMFVLAGLFFNLNLFSGISDASATLDPKHRLFFSKALSLFLTVMSYIFSEAKNAASAWTLSSAASGGTRAAAELSTGAGLILVWMLLVELLRKKVDVIRMRGYSDTIQRAGRVAWLGSLVFFNIKSAGRKAVFSILWILCATRVVQRIAFTEVGKRSYAHGKNARLINSYMANMKLRRLREGHQQQQAGQPQAGACDVEQAVHVPGGTGTAQELLKSCDYIVMGEEKMVKEPTADGYDLKDEFSSIAITVGKVWDKLDETDKKIFTSPSEARRLKRLCLSFALFKLLRRKFERLPAVSADEAQDCRNLILHGLPAEKMIEVVNGEVVFLSEYYHSVVPVVLASPFFLLVNYFLVLAVVAVLCLMAVILCGKGDAMYAFRSIGADNYAFSSGMGRIAVCLLVRARHSAEAFFSMLDLSITVLLFVIYLYEEIWEFFVFLFSNWFMVSLVCNYVAKEHWRKSSAIRWAFRRIIFLRSNLNRGSLRFRQFSVLSLRWPLWPLWLPFYRIPPPLVLSTETVPENLNKSIKEYLEKNPLPLTNGKYALRCYEQLPWACQSDSVSEVILTWHIATCILEVEPKVCSSQSEWRGTAIRLSKYCAYLVVFHRELLPDNPDKVKRDVKGMKKELGDIFKHSPYCLRSQRSRAEKIKKAAEDAPPHSRGGSVVGDGGELTSSLSLRDVATSTDDGAEGVAAPHSREGSVVRDGGELASYLLRDVATSTDDGAKKVWKVLADVWTELVLFVAAPSGDDERMKGHEDVLVQGRGELITVLWALTTHIGVSREARPPARK